MTAKDGLWSPDSQRVIAIIGCGISEVSGIAEKLPLEPQLVRRWMLTWSHPHFGWSAAESWRSHAVMTPVTLLCYRPQVTVWLEKHSDQKSQDGTVWASDQCLGSCTVQYGGQYKSTDGFQQAECNGDIQSANNIGFWCDWQDSDGSVMMIGEGGGSCSGADHGIGITESDGGNWIWLH